MNGGKFKPKKAQRWRAKGVITPHNLVLECALTLLQKFIKTTTTTKTKQNTPQHKTWKNHSKQVKINGRNYLHVLIHVLNYFEIVSQLTQTVLVKVSQYQFVIPNVYLAIEPNASNYTMFGDCSHNLFSLWKELEWINLLLFPLKSLENRSSQWKEILTIIPYWNTPNRGKLASATEHIV